MQYDELLASTQEVDDKKVQYDGAKDKLSKCSGKPCKNKKQELDIHLLFWRHLLEFLLVGIVYLDPKRCSEDELPHSSTEARTEGSGNVRVWKTVRTQQ